MPRTRNVHRSARVADQRQVVSAPAEPAMLTAAETGLYDAAATSPRPTAVNRGGLLHHVQMENVHPLEAAAPARD